MQQETKLNDLEEEFYDEQEKQDLIFLKQHGFPNEYEGITFAAAFFGGPTANYVGMEVSAKGYMQPSYRLKNYNEKKKRKTGIDGMFISPSYSFFVFGFNQCISRREYECWFSPFQLTSLLGFNLTKVGFTKTYAEGGNIHWFYRPELGLGWGAFSYGLGYTIPFNKKYKELYEGLGLTVRIGYPVKKKT